MKNSDSSAMISREKEIQEILKLLKDEVKKIVLEGDAGVGKTWIAEQISDQAVSDDLIYLTCWVFLNQRDESKSPYYLKLVLENIVRQMSVLVTEKKDNEKLKEEEEEKLGEEERLKSLAEEISANLKERGYDKKCLLILDGLPDTMNEDDIMSEINAFLDLTFNVLITRRKERIEGEEMEGVTEIASEGVIEVKKLDPDTSLRLLKERVGEKVKKNVCFEKRAVEIAEKSEGLPAAIVMIAEALKRFREQDSRTLTLEGALEEVAAREKGSEGENSLLFCVYDMLPRRDMALINCWWYSFYFFPRHVVVHYDELIACWIVEGCVGNTDSVEDAYKVGHRVLVELIDRCILKMQDDFVVMEALALTFPDYDGAVSEGEWSLGLARVFDGGDWPVFGRTTWADGMIKTLPDQTWRKHREDSARTLLIDGSRLHREVSNEFFEPWRELRVLVLFNPTFTSLPSTLSEMSNLRLLVLRGCDSLVKNTDSISKLGSLEILEISGATLLEEMNNDFFKKLRKLRSVNLSGTRIKSIPSSISELGGLRWLTLRGCSSLDWLPTLSRLTNLEMVNLSGASKLKRFEDGSLQPLKKLRIFDVSHTKLRRLPFLGNLQNLARLSVGHCESLPRSCQLQELSNLQILDLSGSISLEEIPDESSSPKERLKILDLSNTKIGLLPFNFSSLFMLESLDLSSTKITSLPSPSKLRNLEVLNLSSCSLLEEIGAGSLEHMTRLRSINLSDTKINCLEFLSNLVNLRQLTLKNCGSLEKPSLESLSKSLKYLSKLEELDLCGVTFPAGTEAEFLLGMSGIQLLDLSGTQLKLPNTCKLTNLTKLSLRGCSLSEVELNLGADSKLEILDLSETGITSLPSLENLISLRELKLRGLEKLPKLELLTLLEVLDLRGTQIKQFPESISNLTRLKHLDLPKLNFTKDFDWGKIKHVPEELNWVESSIFEHSQKRPCMLLSHNDLSEILKEDPELEKPWFQNFHFFVRASKGQRRAGDIYLHTVDPSVREVYLKTHHIPEEHRFLEIVGFDRCPDDVEGAFRKAQYFSFIDNKFIISLSDVTAALKASGAENLAMKGCMLEMCSEMTTICGKEDTEVLRYPEILWASNLPKLGRVFCSNVQSGSSGLLRELYLEYCPRLEVVFESLEFSENLEFLQIKFCHNMRRLFSQNIEATLPKLRKLHLLELPALTSIAAGHSRSDVNIFPSIRELYLDRCRLLEAVYASSHPLENLEILEIKFCENLKILFASSTGKFPKLQKLHLLELPMLTSIGIGDLESLVDVFPSMRELYLDRCPMLEAVYASSHPLENLEILEIKFCENLKTLFPSSTGKFPKLQKLHLLELPMLTSIGIGDLESLVDVFPSMRELYLDRCPMLEAVCASSHPLENLEILEIKFCENLKTLFPSSTGKFPKLQKLHLLELPMLTSIGIGDLESLVDVYPSMRELYLDRCPMLEAVFASSQPLENLEILKIRFCDNLKTLSSNTTEFPKLQKLHLVELPELTSVGVGDSKSSAVVFPSVRELYLDGCPGLEALFAASQPLENLEILEIRFCGNLKTLFPRATAEFPGLQKLHLVELHQLTSIVGIFPCVRELYLDRCPVLEPLFASPQPLKTLEILEIKFCDNLKTLFPRATAEFPGLQKLHLVELPELTSIGNSRNIMDGFPSVQSIRVRKCPKLRLEEIRSSKDLRELYLHCCPVLQAVFASCPLPENLEVLEIRFCNNLKTLFPPNITQLPKLQNLHLVDLPQLTGIGVPEDSSVEDVFPSMESIEVRKCPRFKDLGRF